MATPWYQDKGAKEGKEGKEGKAHRLHLLQTSAETHMRRETAEDSTDRTIPTTGTGTLLDDPIDDFLFFN